MIKKAYEYFLITMASYIGTVLADCTESLFVPFIRYYYTWREEGYFRSFPEDSGKKVTLFGGNTETKISISSMIEKVNSAGKARDIFRYCGTDEQKRRVAEAEMKEAQKNEQ